MPFGQRGRKTSFYPKSQESPSGTLATTGGLGAGSIGGALGRVTGQGKLAAEGKLLGHLPEEKIGQFGAGRIAATNYWTSTLNGFGDRLASSLYLGEKGGQAFLNGLFGAADGLYAAHFWSRNWGKNDFNFTDIYGPSFTSKRGPIVGRYLSAGLTQATTSVPGLGISMGLWHGTYAGSKAMFGASGLSTGLKAAAGTTALSGYLGHSLMEAFVFPHYTNAVVSPLLFSIFRQ